VAELPTGFTAPIPWSAGHARRSFPDDLKAVVPVYPNSRETAELVGKIHAESSQRGITIPFDDLMVGACALERGYGIATRNHRQFEKIPGLELVSI
jgi:predicted nucleic acid-binding protein